MRAFKNFILYNNTVPIVLGAIFLSAGVTFAASEDAREAVISSQQALTSVDNTFIRNVNLDTYDVEVVVNSIEEDDEFYYISYTVSSVGLVDGVWQPVTDIRELQVSKAALGTNDLGLRVSKELSDIYASERRLLFETQTIEKNIGRTDKVITTKYDRIIGRMLDAENEVFPGYDPVVTPPPAIPGPKPRKFEEQLDNGQQVVIENQGNNTSSGGSDSSSAEEPTASTTPSITPETTTSSTSTSTPTTPVSSTPSITTPIEPEPEPPVVEPGPEPAPEPVVEPEPTPEPEPAETMDSPAEGSSTVDTSTTESGV